MPSVEEAARNIFGVIVANAALIALAGILLATFQIRGKERLSSKTRKYCLKLISISLLSGFFAIYTFLSWCLTNAVAFFVIVALLTFFQAGLLMLPIAYLSEILKTK
jgi:MFS family permease